MNRKKRKKQNHLSKEGREVKLVGSLSPDDLFDDCLVCQAEKAALKRKKPLTSSELIKVFKKAKEKGAVAGGALFEKDNADFNQKFNQQEMELESIGAAENFKMPAWMECTWRRVPCGKDECRICGTIKRSRLRHIIKGETPDDMKSVTEDAGNSLNEALRIIKQHAEETGIDLENIREEELENPPEPKYFPLYRKVEAWRKNIENIAREAEMAGAPWIFTEAGADLLWYKNMLSAKVYRQLCNRWHNKRGDGYGEFDYTYTKHVLEKCVLILKQALSEFSPLDLSARSKFLNAASNLVGLEKEILNI